LEPRAGEASHLFERAGLLEQVGGPWHDYELALNIHHSRCLAIKFEHDRICFTDDQKRWRSNAAQMLTCQIGATAAGNDGANFIGQNRRGYQRGGRTGARTKVPKEQSTK
jgi:hypothetical protein